MALPMVVKAREETSQSDWRVQAPRTSRAVQDGLRRAMLSRIYPLTRGSSEAHHVVSQDFGGVSALYRMRSITANFDTSSGSSFVEAFEQDTSLAHSLRRQVAATLTLPEFLLGRRSIFA